MLGVWTISSIFIIYYFCSFVLVHARFSTMTLAKDLYRRMSTKDWSEWRWALFLWRWELVIVSLRMCGTKCL